MLGEGIAEAENLTGYELQAAVQTSEGEERLQLHALGTARPQRAQ